MKVLVADDHPLFLDALVLVISQAFGTVECDQALDFDQAAGRLDDESAYDLIVLDFYLPGVQGFSGLIELRKRVPDTPVVMVSAASDAEVMRQAMRFGAAAYLPKSAPAPQMRRVLQLVMDGGTYFPEGDEREQGGADMTSGVGDEAQTLTPRQLAVLRLLGEGKSNKQIARELAISQETVKVHISAILRKLNVTSRTQAVLQAHHIVPAKP